MAVPQFLYQCEQAEGESLSARMWYGVLPVGWCPDSLEKFGDDVVGRCVAGFVRSHGKLA